MYVRARTCVLFFLSLSFAQIQVQDSKGNDVDIQMVSGGLADQYFGDSVFSSGSTIYAFSGSTEQFIPSQMLLDKLFAITTTEEQGTELCFVVSIFSSFENEE